MLQIKYANGEILDHFVNREDMVVDKMSVWLETQTGLCRGMVFDVPTQQLVVLVSTTGAHEQYIPCYNKVVEPTQLSYWFVKEEDPTKEGFTSEWNESVFIYTLNWLGGSPGCATALAITSKDVWLEFCLADVRDGVQLEEALKEFYELTVFNWLLYHTTQVWQEHIKPKKKPGLQLVR